MRGLTPPARERIQPHAQATPVQATVEHSPEANTGRILLRAESDLPPECGRVRSPLLRKLAYLSDRWLLLDWLFVFFVAGLVGIVDQIEPWHKPLNELQLADVNINLPYLPSIISDALVICLSIVMPPLIMLLLVYPCRRHHRGSLSELRIALLAFFTAVVFNLLVTTITKKYVGRPRPNFVEYTGYFNKTYLFAHNKRDAFQSFPSGHASASFAGLGFLSLWAYANLVLAWHIGVPQQISVLSAALGSTPTTVRREAHKAQRNQLPLLGLITLPLWLALYIALTRVRDHHHNSEDVLAGSVLGLAIAYWSYRAVYLGRAVEWAYREPQARIQPGAQQRKSQRQLLGFHASSSASEVPESSAAAAAAGDSQAVELELLRQSSPLASPSPAASQARDESDAGVWDTLRSSAPIEPEGKEESAAASSDSAAVTRLHI